jgi:hypothetical protein
MCFAVYHGRNAAFYRDTNQKEIDFVMEKNMTLYLYPAAMPIGEDVISYPAWEI